MIEDEADMPAVAAPARARGPKPVLAAGHVFRVPVRRQDRPHQGRSLPRPQPAQAAPTGLRLDRSARRVFSGEREIELSGKEYDVLALLTEQIGAVVSREDLMSRVWDENWFGSTKTLDVTIGRLRSKLEAAQAPVRVVNVRGVGFRLEDAESSP